MKLHQDKLKAKIYELMDRFWKMEANKFGVTKAEALSTTREMIREEAEQISGLTCKLKGYLNDLQAAFDVFDA